MQERGLERERGSARKRERKEDSNRESGQTKRGTGRET